MTRIENLNGPSRIEPDLGHDPALISAAWL